MPDNPDRIHLGQTDLHVSPLGIGTWSWGDRLFWGYGRSHDEGDVQAAFEASLAAGINFFDTAEFYGFGRSERLLGQLLRDHQESLIVTTKFMPFPWRLRQKSLLKALRGSLDRLGLFQVDLYLLHWPWPPVSIETWMDGLADAVEAGLARAVGVSNHSAWQMRRAHAALARRGVSLATNQVEYNLLYREPERNGLLDACRELGVTLTAYSPLKMGMLTGKYTPENRPQGFRGREFKPEYLASIQPLVSKLDEIGQTHGKTPAQVALNWIMCKGAVPIPGAKNAHQVEQNAAALGWRLSEDEIARLDQVSEEVTG
jgi:aryl-alcohol dehydrogenase-like predicted oxidoreductase